VLRTACIRRTVHATKLVQGGGAVKSAREKSGISAQRFQAAKSNMGRGVSDRLDNESLWTPLE
jgi:hypothetical protein